LRVFRSKKGWQNRQLKTIAGFSFARKERDVVLKINYESTALSDRCFALSLSGNMQFL